MHKYICIKLTLTLTLPTHRPSPYCSLLRHKQEIGKGSGACAARATIAVTCNAAH